VYYLFNLLESKRVPGNVATSSIESSSLQGGCSRIGFAKGAE
jgi:hypothetical protein